MTDTQPEALQYANRDSMALGEYYLRHISAMTSEALHAKSAIAAELAHRDREIDCQHAELETLRAGYDAARLEIESLHARSVEPACEYPPLPEWSKMDNLGGLVPSEIRQELRAYVDADRAMRSAQPAPENIRSILVRCRDFIDTTKAPAYPAGADLADEIDVLLAAQPAPAAVAGLSISQVTEQMRAAGDHAWITSDGVDSGRVFWAMLSAAPTTQPVHPDDAAVDTLAAHMKTKLAKQRAKGYGGWDDPECSQQRLSDMLRDHVAKGDPVDVANFCAFLTTRCEGIAQPAPQQEAQEPFAWFTDWHPDGRKYARKPHGFNELGAILDDPDLIREVWKPLYAAPQPSPAAQVDALDAARYRYLRDGDWRENDKLESIIRLQLNSLWDAAIDDARAAQEGQ